MTTENQEETIYAELVANSINGESKQQRKLDCPLEMGQLLEGGTNTKASDTKPEELQLVIWKHKGEGRIEDHLGNYIGTFNGDFHHRDSLICAVNSEATLRQQLAESQKQVTLLRGLLLRYRTETPPAHFPHMICHLVDEALAATEPK